MVEAQHDDLCRAELERGFIAAYPLFPPHASTPGTRDTPRTRLSYGMDRTPTWRHVRWPHQISPVRAAPFQTTEQREDHGRWCSARPPTGEPPRAVDRHNSSLAAHVLRIGRGHARPLASTTTVCPLQRIHSVTAARPQTGAVREQCGNARCGSTASAACATMPVGILTGATCPRSANQSGRQTARFENSTHACAWRCLQRRLDMLRRQMFHHVGAVPVVRPPQIRRQIPQARAHERQRSGVCIVCDVHAPHPEPRAASASAAAPDPQPQSVKLAPAAGASHRNASARCLSPGDRSGTRAVPRFVRILCAPQHHARSASSMVMRGQSSAVSPVQFQYSTPAVSNRVRNSANRTTQRSTDVARALPSGRGWSS